MMRSLKIWGLLALVLGLALLSWTWHDRRDRLREPPRDATDASPLVERLARGGFAKLEELRVDVEDAGSVDAAFGAILPQVDEPWVAVTEAIITRQAPVAEEAPQPLLEPAGLVLPGRRALRRRSGTNLPPGARVLVRELDTEVVRETPWTSGEVLVLPASCALSPGQRYEIEVLDSSGEIWARSRVATISEETVIELRSLAAVLRRRVSDATLRRYAQGVVAMSRGLHDRAAQLLLDGHDEIATDIRWPDLAWRRVFLLDRRDDTTRRDRLAARLRGI